MESPKTHHRIIASVWDSNLSPGGVHEHDSLEAVVELPILTDSYSLILLTDHHYYRGRNHKHVSTVLARGRQHARGWSHTDPSKVRLTFLIDTNSCTERTEGK